MRKIANSFGLLCLFGLLDGCFPAIPVQSSVPASNPGYKIELLFEADGCKVYRFLDQGAYRYFTKCKDSGGSSVGWYESCGKNCTRYVDNTTGYPTPLHP